VTEPATYGIVGSGWRAQFFLRLASLLPEHLRVTGVVTRTAGAGERVESTYAVPTHRDVDAFLATGRPDFVITSVPWESNPWLVGALVERGVNVLSETPPAPDLEGLRALWADVGASGRVQVAEQYLLLPDHAVRLELVRRGVIGDPTSAQVSSTHLYHAVSILRGFLGVGLEPATVSARAFSAPLADPLSPAGWSGDGTPVERTTTLATLDWGGRSGLYDFTENQWWNPLRARRVVIRGSLGEIVDDHVVRLEDPRTPVTSPLQRRETGRDLNLEGRDLDHISFDGEVLWRSDYPDVRLSDEELAITAMLRRTGSWARGEGEAPYPLAAACQDHLLSLAMEESVRTGAMVTTSPEPWAAAARAD
jgi:predicted dehydrogenase